MSARWNFRLGPLQFTSPVGAAGTSFVIALVLCCCGGGIIGMVTDDELAPQPVVATTAPASSAPPSPTRKPSPSPTTGRKVVTAGAFCDHAGATGVTKAGTAMVCTGPGDLRWRRR